jgi:hypothetical protein
MRLAILAVLAACTDPPADIATDHVADGFSMQVHDTAGKLSPVLAYDPLCELLPADTTGLCLDLCSPEQLVEDLPLHVCATLYCPLTDGRVIVVDACHL